MGHGQQAFVAAIDDDGHPGHEAQHFLGGAGRQVGKRGTDLRGGADGDLAGRVGPVKVHAHAVRGAVARVVHAAPQIIAGAGNGRTGRSIRIIARHDPDIGAVPPPGLAVFDDQVGWHGVLLVLGRCL